MFQRLWPKRIDRARVGCILRVHDDFTTEIRLHPRPDLRLRARGGERPGLPVLRRVACERRSTVLRDLRQGLCWCDRAGAYSTWPHPGALLLVTVFRVREDSHRFHASPDLQRLSCGIINTGP